MEKKRPVMEYPIPEVQPYSSRQADHRVQHASAVYRLSGPPARALSPTGLNPDLANRADEPNILPFDVLHMPAILNHPDFNAGARHQQKVRREKRDVRHSLRGFPVNRAPVYLTLRCGVYTKVCTQIRSVPIAFETNLPALLNWTDRYSREGTRSRS
jgi:hypothetical protein